MASHPVEGASRLQGLDAILVMEARIPSNESRPTLGYTRAGLRPSSVNTEDDHGSTFVKERRLIESRLTGRVLWHSTGCAHDSRLSPSPRVVGSGTIHEMRGA